MHPAAVARCPSTRVTSSITTTRKSSSAITKEKSLSILKLGIKTSSSRRSANITTSICTRNLVYFRSFALGEHFAGTRCPRERVTALRCHGQRTLEFFESIGGAVLFFEQGRQV